MWLDAYTDQQPTDRDVFSTEFSLIFLSLKKKKESVIKGKVILFSKNNENIDLNIYFSLFGNVLPSFSPDMIQ